MPRPGPRKSRDQVTTSTQFSDVQPKRNGPIRLSPILVEALRLRGWYPDGTFPRQAPAEPREAAALLNACLDRITEVTD